MEFFIGGLHDTDTFSCTMEFFIGGLHNTDTFSCTMEFFIGVLHDIDIFSCTMEFVPPDRPSKKTGGVAKLPPLLKIFIHLFCFHICYSLAVSITASTKDG